MASTLHERLAQALRASGLSNAELARLVGVTRGAVTHWMNGSSPNIRPEHLFAIADALGIEARWLATGKGPQQRISAQQTAFLDAYHQLPPDTRAAVALLVSGIADKRGDYEP